MTGPPLHITPLGRLWWALVLLPAALGCEKGVADYPLLDPPAPHCPSSDHCGPFTTTVERIIDGDTIVVEGGKVVRLLGVDTPETAHPARGEEPFGREAADYVRERIPRGSRVFLDYDVHCLDRYERTLAYVYLDSQCGVMLNEELLELGYATQLPWDHRGRLAHADLLEAAETRARAAALGVWRYLTPGACFFEPAPEGPSGPPRPPNPGELVITEIMANPIVPEGATSATSGWFEIVVEAPEGTWLDLEGVRVNTNLDEPRGGFTLSPKRGCLHVRGGGRYLFATRFSAAPLPVPDDPEEVMAPLEKAAHDGSGSPHCWRVGESCVFYFVESLAVTFSAGRLALWRSDVRIDGAFIGASERGVARQRCEREGSPSWCDAITPYAGDWSLLGTPGRTNTRCGTCLCLDDGAQNDGVLEAEALREAVEPAPGEVMLSEVMARPLGTGATKQNGEWFEARVVARDGAPRDLGCVRVARGPDETGERLNNPERRCLQVASGTYALFAVSDDPAENGYLPPPDALYHPTGAGLPDTGGHLGLRRYDGALLDEVTNYGRTLTAGVARQLTTSLAMPPEEAPPSGNLEQRGARGELIWCDAFPIYGPRTEAGVRRGTPGRPNLSCGVTYCYDVEGELTEALDPQPGELVLTEIFSRSARAYDDWADWLGVQLVADGVRHLNGLRIGVRAVNSCDEESVVWGTPIALLAEDCVPITREMGELVLCRDPVRAAELNIDECVPYGEPRLPVEHRRVLLGTGAPDALANLCREDDMWCLEWLTLVDAMDYAGVRRGVSQMRCGTPSASPTWRAQETIATPEDARSLSEGGTLFAVEESDENGERETFEYFGTPGRSNPLCP